MLIDELFIDDESGLCLPMKVKHYTNEQMKNQVKGVFSLRDFLGFSLANKLSEKSLALMKNYQNLKSKKEKFRIRK